MSQSPKTLSTATLNQLHKDVSIPKYDRNALRTGIVHIGVGGFHRAHQAYYLNQLFNSNTALDWGIEGVGLMPNDLKMYEQINAQQGLYTLVTQHPDGKVISEVMGAIKKMHLAIQNPKEVIDVLAKESTRIISLTITEGGYNVDASTGEFKLDKAAIQEDLANPESPKTVFGYIVASLRQRRDNGTAGVTILSCDNVQHNGDVAKKSILAFAKAQDPTLISWIHKHVTFPNAMVDRITPVTTQETRDFVKNELGIIDQVPINCEPFIQWVIEDNFIAGRPALEKVGAQFVPDVTPYEHMKLRLLNAGHSVLGITGALHGYATIDACVQDPHLINFLRSYLTQEATPTLQPLEGINVSEYIEILIERFGNPNIKDSVSRICSESSAKLPKFLMATIQDNLTAGRSIKLGVFLLAAWCYYSDVQVNEKGEKLHIIDEMSQELHKHASRTKGDSLAFLDVVDVFGNLKNDERFATTYQEMIALIYQQKNILKSIQHILD